MKQKRVLMACCNHWTSSSQVGSHHFAREFVKAGWDVAFISNPISPLHFLGGFNQELSARFSTYKTGGYSDLDGRLWTYVPGALIVPHNKPLLRSEFVHRHWMSSSWPNVVKKVTGAGFGDVDLLYIDNINQFFWLKAIKYKRAVLRVADNNAGFERSTPAMHTIERELVGSVDAVIYTAERLREYVNTMGPQRMVHIPNGVNFKHFSEGSRSLPPEYGAIPKPIAVYVGAMDAWFDYELVNKAAEELPHVSFVLIGPDELARTRLKNLSNIYILGRRKYGELPSYLHNADVGIIPFDVAGYPELVHDVNPLKLYEYLACGLPVVSVEWRELLTLKSPAVLSKTAEQFIQGINEAVSKPQDKGTFVRYASEQDWQARVKILTDFLEELNHGDGT